jgi:threonine dehydratase
MVTPESRVTALMVEEGHTAIRRYLDPTRLIETRDARGRLVHLKLENEQPTGSFKVRGALFNLLRRPPNDAGFVTASAGNHGLGVAWSARRTGRTERVTIFVPESAPRTKIAKLRTFPVDLRVAGETFDDAERAAHEFERESGAVFIHAYDDLLTAAGQGTIAVEIEQALEHVGTLVAPVGGGGLISGNAAWFKERGRGTRIVATQPDASPAFSESIRLGRALTAFAAGPTLADGLAGGIGQIAFNHRDLIDEALNVPEAAIRAAIRRLHHEHGVRAEASGAITLAAAGLPEAASWVQPIVCVISGGNIDDDAFERVLTGD